MADDVAPAVEQDKPIDTTEAPEVPDKPEAGEDSFYEFDSSQVPEDADRDWLGNKYSEMRSAFTKKAQEFGEGRRELEQARQLHQALRNPQVAPAVLAQLGYDEKKVLEMYGYQPDEEEPEFDEFDTDSRVERLERTLAQRETAERQAQREEAVTDFIAEQIEALEQKEDREFDAEEHRLLDAYARQFARESAMGPVPDVEGAYALLSGLYSNREKASEKALLNGKRKTPRPPGGGKPGSRTVDLSKESKEDRLARMADAVNEHTASAQ